MEHIAPLLQTVLWVGLIGGIVYRYQTAIDGILNALHKRLESGSTLKAGPFELGDSIKPQGLESQRERAEKEIVEAQQSLADPLQAPKEQAVAGPPTADLVRRKYFLVEDLALRTIQAEYGATLSRQVAIGRDSRFDAAFVRDGVMHAIEVKYLAGLRGLENVRASLTLIDDAVARNQWKKFRLLLVIVFEHDRLVAEGIPRIEEMARDFSIEVVVKGYSRRELQRRFGVEDTP